MSIQRSTLITLDALAPTGAVIKSLPPDIKVVLIPIIAFVDMESVFYQPRKDPDFSGDCER